MGKIDFKSLAIQLSAASGVQYLIGAGPKTGLTTLLFHRFFFGEEEKDKAFERLKRQLDWLCQEYTPLGLAAATNMLAADTLPKHPLLITADDAITDLLEVHQIFRSFSVPLAIFVCAGWTSQAGPIEPESVLSHVVAALEWYEGLDVVISVGNSKSIRISRAERSTVIDNLLRSQNGVRANMGELARKLDALKPKGAGRVCSWTELADLQREGAQIGCHSVSHIRLAAASSQRLAFEIHESKRVITKKLGEPAAFAYPFGIEGTFSDQTTAELKNAGFKFAFLTHPGFASADTDPLHLPRIVLPDRDMSLNEFRARVRGGGVPLRRAQQLLKVRNSR